MTEIERLRGEYLAALECALIEHERYVRGEPDQVDVARERALAANEAYHLGLRGFARSGVVNCLSSAGFVR